MQQNLTANKWNSEMDRNDLFMTLQAYALSWSDLIIDLITL